MSDTQHCKAIIIDPRANDPFGLKIAAKEVSEFTEFLSADSFTKGNGLTEEGNPTDVVFIAYELGVEDAQAYIKKAKAKKRTQDAAFVMVVRKGDQDKLSIAQLLSYGLDGFVFEPFSVESLQDIVKLAEEVKKLRTAERQKATIILAVQEVLPVLDRFAVRVSIGRSPALLRKQFAESCELFHSYSDEMRAVYFDALVEATAAVPKPQKVGRKKR